MGNQITSYKEVKLDFGSSDNTHKYPLPGEMFVFYGPDEEVESVDFLCPCGCGSTCYTPVTTGDIKQIRHWQFRREPSGNITLSPSIRYTGGCRAHFNITDGKVIIHSDSGH